MWQQYNPNPKGLQVGDCVIRALAKATGKTWEQVYIALCVEGLGMCDMPSANRVWGHWLQEQGFKRNFLPDACPSCYTVAQFTADHPSGLFILCMDGHVACVEDGSIFDTWDSSERVPLYYWIKEES